MMHLASEITEFDVAADDTRSARWNGGKVVKVESVQAVKLRRSESRSPIDVALTQRSLVASSGGREGISDGQQTSRAFVLWPNGCRL